MNSGIRVAKIIPNQLIHMRVSNSYPGAVTALTKVIGATPIQGLPARIAWIGLGDRHRAGLAFNEMVASGELNAPVVIGRDHLHSGSVASPNRETEAMMDGSAPNRIGLF